MIFADCARLPGGWADRVRVIVEDGRIAAVHAGVDPEEGDRRVSTLLPAVSNLHSHTFQRAMAGMTEHSAVGRESFWTWRDLMYRFLDRLAPEDIGAIAAFAFMEMQEAGFAAVGEFHYVHHQRGGARYVDPAELSVRIFEAAALTGIGLTHLPVLYSHGGAGGLPLGEGQRRFGTDPDAFADLMSAIREAGRALPPDTRIGIAPHSLRATTPDALTRVLPLAEGGPIHIHVAEQPREVAEIEAWLGQRPVAWLLDHAPVGPDWCAVHATHMTVEETRGLARTGAVAGLCPVTEANLGDGPFDGPGWLAAGGRYGIGTDSNVRISMAEELRTLEYSQRLRDLARNVMVAGAGSVGASLYDAAAAGGAQALGRDAGRIAAGCLADLVAIDAEHPSLIALGADRLLDGVVFAAPEGVVTDLWSAGRHAVREGRHIAREGIVADWRRVMARLVLAM